VRALLDAKADISLVEIQAELRRRGIGVGATSTISRWLRRSGLTHKKSRRAASRLMRISSSKGRRPHQVRLEGGDCSSDAYCYP
jgi:hypothetical protein